MDSVNRNSANVGAISRGYTLDFSPTFSDFEIMQYIRQPLRPVANEISILVNVSLLQQHDVKIDVLEGSKIEVRVKHELKQNSEGLWMSRNAVYTYELPPECCKKAIKAQWFADNVLLIKTISSEMGEKECVDQASVVIERVDTRFRPVIEMSVMKEFVEDIRNRAEDTIHYLRFAVNDPSILVKKDSQDMVNKQSGKTSMADSGVMSMGDSGKISKDDSPTTRLIREVLQSCAGTN